MRKLPESEVLDDSVEFAEYICGYLSADEREGKAETVVNMCNVMAMASANREMPEVSAYEETVLVFCWAIADYILGRRDEELAKNDF